MPESEIQLVRVPYIGGPYDGRADMELPRHAVDGHERNVAIGANVYTYVVAGGRFVFKRAYRPARERRAT